MQEYSPENVFHNNKLVGLFISFQLSMYWNLSIFLNINIIFFYFDVETEYVAFNRQLKPNLPKLLTKARKGKATF